jgi:alkanesulfonate monooxygenase SsuD/methylene tetrahydromethanopterin reductase-like flavin-dependent oxidoreductase (luciferase family)
MLEAYTTLGYFAGLTEKTYLGVLVTGVIYRHPSVLMKVVNTLDILSGGRAYLGIGAAWVSAQRSRVAPARATDSSSSGRWYVYVTRRSHEGWVSDVGRS